MVFFRNFVTVTKTGLKSPGRRLFRHTKAKTASGILAPKEIQSVGLSSSNHSFLGVSRPDGTDGTEVLKVYLGSTPKKLQGSFQRMYKLKAFPYEYHDTCHLLRVPLTTQSSSHRLH